MSLLILESALRALALAIAASAALTLFRVRNVLAQKCAWTVVLSASLLMPVLLLISAQWPALPTATLRIPAISRYQAAAQVHAQAQAHTVALPHTQLSPAVPATHGRFPAPVVSPDHAVVAAPQPAPAAPRLNLSSLAWLLYFAIAGVFLARLIHGLGSSLTLWLKSEPVSPSTSRLAPGLHLRTSREVSSPVNIWAGVVLPADYITWDEMKLRIVLAHERSHVRQGDFYLQLLAGLYQSLVWFSPLGWWLKRKLSDLGEAISDRAGLAEAASRFSYAQVLLEFAVAPRTPMIGVAMARPSSLSLRIDRLLNESAFRQAFAGGRRPLLAALIVPVILFAASTLVRVQAAPVQAQSSTTGQSHPDAAPILDSTDAQPKPQNKSQPEPQPQTAATANGTSYAADTSYASGTSKSDDNSPTYAVTNTINPDGGYYSYSNDGKYAYSHSDNGDAYALVLNNDDNFTFSGTWTGDQREEIERARKAAGTGSFLWFKHDGKSYIITDPAIIAQVDAMYRPILELGKQQEELGSQQEALGKLQEALGQAQEAARANTPELSEQMDKLKTELAALQSQIDKQVTHATVDSLQASLSEVQARIGAIQGEIGAKQGEIGAKQGELGSKQGKLGAEQGRLGAEQGKLAREADQKVKSIIDQSLKNGTAQPTK